MTQGWLAGFSGDLLGAAGTLAVLAALVLAAFLYHVDRAPKVLHDDYE